jgi:hypothetical protein
MSGKIKSIRGPIGPPGPPGIRGGIGNTGPTGEMGPPGASSTGSASPYRFDPTGANNTRIVPINNVGNSVTSDNSSILAGINNTISANISTNAFNGAILSGEVNNIRTLNDGIILNAFIGGGTGNNIIKSGTGGIVENLAIINGQLNTISATGISSDINNSIILNGVNNTIRSSSSAILGGFKLPGPNAILNGERNLISATGSSTGLAVGWSTICAGFGNIISNTENARNWTSTIGGGRYCRILSSGNQGITYRGAIVNGNNNTISSNDSSVFESTIVAGDTNRIISNTSGSGRHLAILCGMNNLIQAANTGNSFSSAILAGESNTIKNSTRSGILGGLTNLIGTGSNNSSIIGGINNTIFENHIESVIIGGTGYTSHGPSTINIGGTTFIKTMGATSTVLNFMVWNNNTQEVLYTTTIPSATGAGSVAITETGPGVFNFFPDGNTAGTATNRWDQPFIFNVKNVSSTRIRPLNNVGNSVTSDNSTVAGGTSNTINGPSLGFIGGGSGNIVSATGSSIVGGIGNIINPGSKYSIIASGKSNTINNNAIYSGIFSGTNNTIGGSYYYNRVILSGMNNNIMNSTYGVITGGRNNSIINSTYGMISGGRNNSINSSNYSVIFGGGYNNTISGGVDNIILGGLFNRINSTSGITNLIFGGASNTIDTFVAFRSAIISSYNSGITATNGSIILAGSNNKIVRSGFSAIIGGSDNTIIDPIIAASTRNIILGGYQNLIKASVLTSCILGGSTNLIGTGTNDSVVSGRLNTMVNNKRCIITGISNSIGAEGTGVVYNSGIIGGASNNIFSTAVPVSVYNSIIIGGEDNGIVNSNRCIINGGLNNSIGVNDVASTVTNSGIIAGRDNIIGGLGTNRTQSVICGGNTNTINSNRGFIAAATLCTISGANINQSCILGGDSNLIGTGTEDSVASGKLNIMVNSKRCIISGISNSIGTGGTGGVYNSGIIGGSDNSIFSTDILTPSSNSIIMACDESRIINGVACIISGGRGNLIGVNDENSVVENSGIVAGINNVIGVTGTTLVESVICGGNTNKINSNRGFIAAASQCIINGVNNFAIIGADNRTATGLATGPGLLTENLHFINQFMFSDEREKDNIIRLSETKFDPVSSIKRIEPISFNWKNTNISDRHYGFSAQNCEAVLPWTTNKQRLVRLEYIPEEDMYKNIDNEERFSGKEYLIQSSPEGPFLITNMNNDEGIKTVKPTSIQALTMMGLKKLIERVEYLERKVEELLEK